MIALLLAHLLVAGGNCGTAGLAASWKSLLATHPGVAASREREKAREAAWEGSAASLWPRVDATGSWQYNTETPRLQLALPSVVPGTPPLAIDRELGDHDRVETGVQASWVLFSGFSTTHARRRDERGLEASRADAAQLRSMLASQMAGLDLSIRGEVVELRLRRARLSARTAWLANWQARLEAGTATRSQVLQARADLLRARADTVSEGRRLDSLRTEFRALAGTEWPGSVDDSMVDRICQESIPDAPGETWQERSLLRQSESVREARDASGASRWPWITATAAVRSGDPGMNQFGTGWDTWGVAGVQMQWNLFDGFERGASQRRLYAESRSLELEAARVRVQKDAQWSLLREEFSRVGSEREAVAAALEAAVEAREATDGAMRSGAALPDDLLDARLRESELLARRAFLDLREASIALRLRSLSGQPLSFEGAP